MNIEAFLESEKGRLISRAEWARRLGVTRGYFSQLALGHKRPSLEVAFDIEKLTKGAVRMQDWFENSETKT